MDKRLAGQILLITMGAINGRKGSTGIHHLPAHIYAPRTDCGTGPAKQAPGKNILKHSAFTTQLRELGQMDLAPGGMGLLTSNPIDRADHGTGPAFSAGIHGFRPKALVKKSSIRWLSGQAHDVFSVFDHAAGADDIFVLKKAHSEQRILITNDKDFGEMIFRQGLPHCGVVLMRLDDERASVRVAVIRRLLAQYSGHLRDNFIVVTEETVRIAKRR